VATITVESHITPLNFSDVYLQLERGLGR